MCKRGALAHPWKRRPAAKIVAASCQVKIVHHLFAPGLSPGLHWESLQRSPDLLVGSVAGGSQPLPKNPTPPRPFRLRLTICPPLEKNPANAYASTATVDMDLFVEESSLDRTVRG